MTATILYRDAVPDDAPALVRLFASSFTDTFGHLYRPEDLAAFLRDFPETRWAAELCDPDYAVRLAMVGARAVGFAKLGQPSLPVTPAGAATELRQLYLLPEAQGTGAAAAMMDWVIGAARARGAGELFLSVYVDNHRARRFYERYGFARIGRYTFMVGAHADEDDLMRLALDDREAVR